ncbi:MAG: GNAT family N-acetyltransferase [Thermodesulfovibrionales bacterium]
MRENTASESPASVPLPGGWAARIFTKWDFPPRVTGQWESILAAYGDLGVFIGPAWFGAWWSAFGAGKELFVVVLEREGRVLAVFPCCIPSGPGGETVSSLTNDHTCHYDFIIEPEVRHEALSVFLGFLKKAKPGAGIFLEYFPVSGSNGEPFFAGLQRAGIPSHRYGQPWAPRLEISGEWEEFRKTLPGRLKNAVRRNRRKAEGGGKLFFEVIRKSEQLDMLLDTFFEIEYNNWKGRKGTAVRCSADTEKFYRDLARRTMRSGHLLVFLLKQGDTPLAASFCLYSGNTVFQLKSGYHEAYGHFTPGNLLQYESINYLFSLPEVRCFHFLGACEPWKMEWTAQTGEYGWIRAFPKSLKGWGQYTLRYGWKRAVKRFRSVLTHDGRGEEGRNVA